MVKAVKKANLYVEAGIKTAVDLGQGSGPINHFHSVYMLPFTPGNFISYLLDRDGEIYVLPGTRLPFLGKYTCCHVSLHTDSRVADRCGGSICKSERTICIQVKQPERYRPLRATGRHPPRRDTAAYRLL